MIGLKFIGHDEAYDGELIVKLFYDQDAYRIIEDDSEPRDFEWYIENKRFENQEGVFCESRILDTESKLVYSSKRKLDADITNPYERKATLKRINKITLYEALESLTPSKSKWGTLVGIRPVKIVHEFLDKGASFETIRGHLESLKVSEEKIDLVCEIALRERPFVVPSAMDELSLYISIPFCPTRCHYCSFPSNDLKKKGQYIPAYLEHIVYELKAITAYLDSKEKTFDCIYIGGGTPSVLSAAQMDQLILALQEMIDFSKIREFTFEAGRPDMITYDKLEILKSRGVTRLCLNPQTFNDQTLLKVGRAHTTDEFCEAYYKVLEFDFDVVNFDLILGLADESLDEMKSSIERAILLNPENITIHTLAIKRASQIKEFNESHLVGDVNNVEEAIDFMYREMAEFGYVPYYMYRQKNMVGNLENVGFCKACKESLYNIRMMEERHTIIALGAGAVSKVVFPNENRFERHASPKGLDVFLENKEHYLKKHLAALKLKFK